MMDGTDKKRILMVSANAWDEKALRLDKEYRAVKEVLLDSTGRDRFDINLLSATQDSDFQRELLNYKPHVVHFSGHGEEHGLAFDAGDDTSRWVDNETLVGFFKSAAAHLECVVFNACYTESLAEAVSEHIDYAVGMNDPIDDMAAIHFSRGFYTGLFAGKFYPAAFDQGILAVQARGLPDHLTPQLKIRESARRVPFAPGCDPDILILCPEANKEWARMVRTDLDDLLSLRFGSRNTFTLALATDADETLPDAALKAGLLLPVVSARFEASTVCQEALDAFVSAAGSGGLDRIFPLQTDGAPLPEALRAVLPYPFWKTGGVTVSSGDARFHATLDGLVREVAARLHRLRDEIEYRRKQASAHAESPPGEKVELPDAFLFLNAAPEDRPLLEEIARFLDENEGDYAEPIPMSANPTPEEIRRDLELNLEACDLYVVIYGKSRMPWVREQVLFSRRMWRKRRQETKIVVVHADAADGPKADIRVSAKNLRIFNCPPHRLSDYLPQCMGEICHE
jgi:hypothetical protein